MKKRSAAKSREERRKLIRLLLDETLAGKSIVQGLLKHDIPVIPLDRIIPRGSSDEQVLDALSSGSDLYLLTRDSDFRYRPAIKQRLVDAQVGAFVITSAGNKTGAQIVELVASAWGRIQKFALNNRCPFVAKITGAGKVESHR